MKKCVCSHHSYTEENRDSCHVHNGDSGGDSSGGNGEHPGHEQGGGELTTRRQDIISLVLAIALALPAFLLHEGAARTILMLAAILAVGWPIFWQGVKNILKLDLEELALLTIAVTAACVIGEFPEALLVTLLFRVGEMLEDAAVSRSRREVEAITKIIPENANLLLEDGSTRLVAANDLRLGQRILIKSGERVPADGMILAGESSLDTSSLTGESTPREVRAGDGVLSGTVNLGGVLTVETTSTYDNSTAARIVAMVRDAAARKGRTERMISRFARVYTPIVIAVAILTAVLPPLLGFGTFVEWTLRSLVFLVASCPCALVISVPLAFFAGIGAASKRGVLIKGSRYVEALAAAETVVFDKTGTLTTGKLSVSEAEPVGGVSRQELLGLAAVCESYSNHPIARAIVEHAGGKPELTEVTGVEEITSYGISAKIAGARVLCGSARLMERFSIDVSSMEPANVYVARDSALLGAIRLLDLPRADAGQTVAALRSLGIRKTVMLTGDDTSAANQIKKMVGLDAAVPDLLPQDKVGEIEKLKAGGSGKTLYVGDGVNDAPVLAMSDAGIAMGLGSDSAIEAADIVLLSDKLSSLPQAIRIARKTSALARFNIIFALSVKLAVFVLAFFGLAGMWMAVFADVGVSILAVLNATRAIRFK